jgi:hypothetical protein
LLTVQFPIQQTLQKEFGTTVKVLSSGQVTTPSNCPILALVHAVIVLLAAPFAPVVVDGGNEVAVLSGSLTKWTTPSTSFLDKTGNQNWG